MCNQDWKTRFIFINIRLATILLLYFLRKRHCQYKVKEKYITILFVIQENGLCYKRHNKIFGPHFTSCDSTLIWLFLLLLCYFAFRYNGYLKKNLFLVVLYNKKYMTWGIIYYKCSINCTLYFPPKLPKKPDTGFANLLWVDSRDT